MSPLRLALGPVSAPRVAGRSPGPTGHVFWMTSGQLYGPMRGEVAYAASKAALAGLTKTVAAELLDFGIVLNTIDPGPVNTGYLDPETTDRPLDEIEEWMRATPFGRFGHPSDPARLIGWLATDAGQVGGRRGSEHRRRVPARLRGGPFQIRSTSVTRTTAVPASSDAARSTTPRMRQS